MPQQKVKVKVFEIPEKEKSEELMKQIKPLIAEWLRQTRNERQIEIDNAIIQASSVVLESARENGLQIEMENLVLEPLWSKAVVMSDRKVVATLKYQEEKKKVHTATISVEVVINIEEIALKAKIECKTSFDEFVNPNQESVLLLNDSISEKFGTNVKVFSKNNATISKLKITGNGRDVLEAQRLGGEITVYFSMKQGIGADIKPLVKKLRDITTAYASADLFAKGMIAYREMDASGHILSQRDITQQQALEMLIG